jgi:hypothetical protein
MLKTIAPFVRPRQVVDCRTAGKWRITQHNETDELLDVLPLQFSPNSTTIVTAQLRYAGRWKPDVLPIEECEDA